MAEITKDMCDSLDELLKRVDLGDVNAESSGRVELPDGCYKCEVKKGELKISSTNKIMAAFQFQIIQDGIDVIMKEDSEEIEKVPLPNTKGGYIFKNYILEDEKGIKTFVSDMLKFEGEVEGESYLPKEAFTTSATLEASVETLADAGLHIWIQKSSYTKKDGTVGSWISLVSWERVDTWELE